MSFGGKAQALGGHQQGGPRRTGRAHQGTADRQTEMDVLRPRGDGLGGVSGAVPLGYVAQWEDCDGGVPMSFGGKAQALGGHQQGGPRRTGRAHQGTADRQTEMDVLRPRGDGLGGVSGAVPLGYVAQWEDCDGGVPMSFGGKAQALGGHQQGGPRRAGRAHQGTADRQAEMDAHRPRGNGFGGVSGALPLGYVARWEGCDGGVPLSFGGKAQALGGHQRGTRQSAGDRFLAP